MYKKECILYCVCLPTGDYREINTVEKGKTIFEINKLLCSFSIALKLIPSIFFTFHKF